jgi:tetratricopeptide (TPR) repeat protein
MYAFPTSVDAAWLTAEAMTSEQRWAEALLAASQWRQRSAGRAIGADMIVAEARLRMGDVQAALREIQPYLPEALADPASYPQVIISHVRSLIAGRRIDEAQTVLRPLLGQDESWRTLWSQIAALAIDDVDVAASWLGELERHVSQTKPDELTRLAQAWWTLYLRSHAPAHRDAAWVWADRATSAPDASAEVWMLKGIVAESMGKTQEAREAYRKSLSRNPRLLGAMNNLAMLLIDDPDQLDEATRLAQTAVDVADPPNAAFFDTLAKVHARGGGYKDAVDAMKRSVAADPGNPHWQWNLLDLYEAGGFDTQAERLHNELQLQYPRGRPSTRNAIQ